MDEIAFNTIRVIFLAVVGFISAFLVTPLVAKLIEKYALKKQLRTHNSAPIYHSFHKNKQGTPTMGGVIIWGTVISLSVIFFILNYFGFSLGSYFNIIDRKETYLPLATLFFAGILGLFDDLLGVYKIGPKGGGLSILQKIFLYLAIASIGAWWFYYKLGFDLLLIPFSNYFMNSGPIYIGLWYIPFFIFVIVASAFSANETDGLDGLLGGVSLFAFGALTVIAFTLGKFNLAGFSAIVTGSLLAFLWFNIYPARFFMGDTGSMAIGITLGVMAMLTNTTIFLPFLVPIFIIESLSVIVQMISKKIRGKKIFLSTPIHHHFEALGWHESKITMRFWIISAVGSGLGLALFFLSQIIP